MRLGCEDGRCVKSGRGSERRDLFSSLIISICLVLSAFLGRGPLC